MISDLKNIDIKEAKQIKEQLEMINKSFEFIIQKISNKRSNKFNVKKGDENGQRNIRKCG